MHCSRSVSIINNYYYYFFLLGRCQSNGELRLSRLHNQGQRIDVPDGFSLVGMRSPQLGSIMILAVVDKR